MSTATIPAPVTWCPPSTYGHGHGTWDRPAFDRYQFAGRRAKAVSAESHLSFQDFGSMQVSRHAVQQVRRLETPAWALTDAALGEAVLRYCEHRLYLRHCEELTLRERLARITYESRRAQLALRKSLNGLLIQYHEWAVSKSRSVAQMKRLEIEVRNRESQILLLERGVLPVCLCVAFLYWRMGWDSVAIAENYKLKSPAIRQMLARMRIVNDSQKIQGCCTGRCTGAEIC